MEILNLFYFPLYFTTPTVIITSGLMQPREMMKNVSIQKC